MSAVRDIALVLLSTFATCCSDSVEGGQGSAVGHVGNVTLTQSDVEDYARRYKLGEDAALKAMLEDEALAQEALRRGLGAHPVVRREVTRALARAWSESKGTASAAQTWSDTVERFSRDRPVAVDRAAIDAVWPALTTEARDMSGIRARPLDMKLPWLQTVIAKSGDYVLPAAFLLAAVVQTAPGMRSRLWDPKRREDLVRSLCVWGVLARQATAQGAMRAPQVRAARRHALARTLERRLSMSANAEKVEEHELRDYYVNHPGLFAEGEWRRVRLVRVESPQEAKEWLTRASQGSYAWRASATLSPRLSARVKGELPVAVHQAAMALSRPGQLHSSPITTASGYYVVELAERYHQAHIPFDTARSRMVRDLRRQHLARTKENLLAKVQIKLL